MEISIEEYKRATAAELSEMIGVTQRRIRQLYEEGYFRKAERGKFWRFHCADAYATLNQFGNSARSLDCDTLAAVQQILNCAIGRNVYPPEDRKAWRKAMAEKGLTADQADAALFRAAAFLGNRCPRFE